MEGVTGSNSTLMGQAVITTLSDPSESGDSAKLSRSDGVLVNLFKGKLVPFTDLLESVRMHAVPSSQSLILLCTSPA